VLRRLSLPAIQEPWQRTLYITFFGQLVSAAAFSIIFPFLPLYVEYLGSTTGLSLEFWAGMVISSQAITMAIASPVWGVLADRYGRKMMLERALFGGAVILCLMAFARSAEELTLLRAIQGLITGTICAANALVAAQAPRERMGYAMGLLQVGVWGGVAVGPLFGGVLADAYGFRVPFIATGVLLLVSGILVWRGVREGFVPACAHPGERVGLVAGWRQIVGLPGVAITYAVRFLSGVGQTMIQPIAPLFIQSLLASSAWVGTYTGVVAGLAGASSIGGAIYLARLGDRIGQRQVLRTSLLAAALLYLPQTFVGSIWHLLILQTLAGVALGGITPALSALLGRYGRAGEEGAIYGLDNSISSAARAAAPMLGASVAMWFDLREVFAATGVIFLVATVLAGVWLPGGQPSMRGLVAASEAVGE
jgi:DHA1 family multidrug resistance protein-like MFS transporter